MSKLFGCASRSGTSLFCVVVNHRNFSISSNRPIEWRVPWEYLHGRRKLAEAFPNKFRFERVAALGPDLACLEWLMKCGASSVEMSDGTLITTQKQMREFIKSHGIDVKQRNLKPLCDVQPMDTRDMLALNKNKTKYTERWSNVPQVFIKAVDASDSVVADPGFQYFQECYNLEKLVLGFCDFFTDLAFDHLAAGRASITLKELEIMFNPNLSDVAFYSISKLTALKRAHFYFNPYVINENAAKQRLRAACPKCYITYPEVKLVGTGK